MGTYAYILAAAFVLTGSMILLSQRQDTGRAEVDLGRIQMKQEARDAAVTGLNLTIRELAEETGPWDNASDYAQDLNTYGGRGATYETVVTIVDTVAGDTVDVVSTGTKVYSRRNGTTSDTTHVIQARIARGYLYGATPPGFRSAIMSDNELLIHGDFSVNALINGVNADIHTNGRLRARGRSFTVSGMGTYTGSEMLTDEQELLFTPPNDWNGSSGNVFQRDSIPLPDWDADRFRSDAQSDGFYTDSPLLIDGEVLASAGVTTAAELAVYLGLDPTTVAASGIGTSHDKPFLIMVDEAITFDNAVYLDGHIQFGSTGEIDVQTHGPDDGLFMSYTLDQAAGLAETHAALFTTDVIRIEGNAEIHGTLYAEGSITYLGGTHLIGGQIAKETTFQGGGTVDIDWVGPGPGIDEYFDPYDEPIGPVIVAYAEW